MEWWKKNMQLWQGNYEGMKMQQPYYMKYYGGTIKKNL
jgi:hypothetical protein